MKRIKWEDAGSMQYGRGANWWARVGNLWLRAYYDGPIHGWRWYVTVGRYNEEGYADSAEDAKAAASEAARWMAPRER